ncbi:MAG: hotdog fold thioesterase [Flammeovirgaceae bacterium]|nr:hotdog fold thioesterase [Flammeovirgaceae bacterium]
MSIFRQSITLDQVNAMSRNTLAEVIGIEFTALGDDFMEAKMPVDKRTQQPFGLLHGGASVALAETMGSVSAFSVIDPEKFICVGLEINANHIKGVTKGWVKGVARPIHLGSKTHVWEIRISTEQNELVCISRITMAILEKKK